MNVSTIMSKDISICGPENTLEDAALRMWESDCGSLPICDNAGMPVGIVTDRDIAMASMLKHRALWEITAQEVSNGRAVYTCRHDDDVIMALKTMLAQKVRRLPVINNEGRAVGMLSIDDIVIFAQRGSRGLHTPELSFDDAMSTLKAVCKHH